MARGPGRRVCAWYLSTGAALAVFRVSLLASQEMAETVDNLFWLLRPEILLGEFNLDGGVEPESWVRFCLSEASSFRRRSCW